MQTFTYLLATTITRFVFYLFLASFAICFTGLMFFRYLQRFVFQRQDANSHYLVARPLNLNAGMDHSVSGSLGQHHVIASFYFARFYGQNNVYNLPKLVYTSTQAGNEMDIQSCLTKVYVISPTNSLTFVKNEVYAGWLNRIKINCR